MPATNADEAAALTYKLDVHDIYSNSWGPADDGATLAPLNSAQQAALTEGVTKVWNADVSLV